MKLKGCHETAAFFLSIAGKPPNGVFKFARPRDYPLKSAWQNIDSLVNP
ncbi:hypothetical protein CHCC14820_1847 [Bacillus paralicheniformis]|uniref:Uncharacterized protein n=1 Tax=Bacillus paralicheniformis TaxID=1648923 RepID=A0A6I7TPI8_9BACI|nr:hypothetical protein SC10_B2orf03653 [Bacillus paralicheniformis]ETB69649.1 hypothetical protein A943_19695 [Bacillus sp. CPSM8]OLF90116.1 hypothetical protein B4121_3391 [Bacillus paralicheniformis]OLG07806.1 hypothetical protein B4125_1987 [Bacillus paralicheniformis]TWJ33272.1 hypothetical protein CHCC5027_3232 [Bacillus paralicheniformis]